MINNKKIINFFNKLFILIGIYYIAFLAVLIASIFIEMPFLEKYGYLFGVIPCAIGCFIMFFCPGALIDHHPIKYTFSFNFKNYGDFITFLDANMKKFKLERLNEQKDDIVLYTRTSYFRNWQEYYIAFNFDEISESAEEAICNMSEILSDMTRNIKSTWRTSYVCGFFICVNKENEVFHEVINEQWSIPISENVYTVGCSFEKKNVYIITPKVAQYSRHGGNPLLFLFKRIRKIMNFKIKNAKEKIRL